MALRNRNLALWARNDLTGGAATCQVVGCARTRPRAGCQGGPWIAGWGCGPMSLAFPTAVATSEAAHSRSPNGHCWRDGLRVPAELGTAASLAALTAQWPGALPEWCGQGPEASDRGWKAAQFGAAERRGTAADRGGATAPRWGTVATYGCGPAANRGGTTAVRRETVATDRRGTAADWSRAAAVRRETTATYRGRTTADWSRAAAI